MAALLFTSYYALVAFSLILLSNVANSIPFQQELAEGEKRPPTAKPNLTCPTNMTSVHFYFHDIVQGANATTITVAPGGSTGFGSLTVMDDPLTETADPQSRALGKYQGIYVSAARSDLALLMEANIILYQYKGSYLALQGRNAAFQPIRELLIVGGTGAFRGVHGYALAHTVSLSFTTAVVEYAVCFNMPPQ